MTAKEYLNQIRSFELAISRKRDEISRLYDDILSASGIDYSKPRVDSSPSGDAAFERTIAEIGDRETEVHAMVEQMTAARIRITRQIDGMDDEIYRMILERHYVNKIPLQDIADEVHYSRDAIWHKHLEALEAFERKYGAEFNK